LSAFSAPQNGVRRLNRLQSHCAFHFDKTTKTSALLAFGDGAFTKKSESAWLHSWQPPGPDALGFAKPAQRLAPFATMYSEVASFQPALARDAGMAIARCFEEVSTCMPGLGLLI